MITMNRAEQCLQGVSVFLSGVMGFIILSLICSNIVQAREGVRTSVQHDNGRFTIESNMVIQLPEEDVRAILMDFNNLPRINSDIRTVTLLSRHGQTPVRMRINSEVCALLMCMDYTWVQSVRVLPSGDIVTHFDPTLSDFREGWVRYRLIPEGYNTRLIMNAVLVPDFWFPPLIGPMIIKSKLRDEALETALGIERLQSYAAHLNGDNRRRFALHARTP